MTTECPCPRCGVLALPRVEPGTGPHGAKAVCPDCGGFVKWLPKTQEQRMVAGVNRVILLGEIGKQGVEVRFSTGGSPAANFLLVVSEQGSDGKVHDVYVACEVWGKRAEQVGACEPGQLVLFEGKLRARKKGEQWETIVSGFDVALLQAGQAVAP